MAFFGDYHTHTTYSHGKGSVADNARAAAAVGLKEIAITDHGLRHIIFGISPARNTPTPPNSKPRRPQRAGTFIPG